jgi:hypothetical protein
MNSFIWLIIFLVVWIVIQKWVLPRFGVPT